MSYSSVSDEALEALILAARDELAERRRGVSPRTIDKFTSLDSPNFMGLGMSLQQMVVTGQVERNMRAFGNQDRVERGRRLDFVIRLSAELSIILKTTHFSSALARQAISDVIEGDWMMVKSWGEHFAFDHEQGDLRHRMQPVFARFCALLKEVVDSAPRTEPLVIRS